MSIDLLRRWGRESGAWRQAAGTQVEAWWPIAKYTYGHDGDPVGEVVNSVVGTRTWGCAGNGSLRPTGHVSDCVLSAARTYDGDRRLSQLDVEGGATYDFSWDPILEVPEVREVFMGETTWSRLAYGNERVGSEHLRNTASAVEAVW